MDNNSQDVRVPGNTGNNGPAQQSASVSFGQVIPTSVPVPPTAQPVSTPSQPLAAPPPAPQPTTAQPGFTPTPVPRPDKPTIPHAPKQQLNWKKIGKIAAIIILILLILGGIALVVMNLLNRQTGGEVLNASRFNTVQIPLEDLAGQDGVALLGTRSLLVNGPLRANSSFTISPSAQPSNANRGQLYFDQNTNQLAYFNGSRFVPVADSSTVVESISGISGQIILGAGLSGANGQITNSGVLTVQGQAGAVTLTGGPGITVDGTTIINSGVTSLGGQTGDITLGSGLAVSPSGELQNSGIVSATGGTGISVVNDGSGNITISNTGAGTGTVQSPGGTPGRLAKFTGVQTIEDSLLSEAGTVVTVNGDLSVTGALTLGTALTVGNGGTGATSLANNGVVIGQGAGALTAVTAGGSGLCFMSTAGAPAFQACPGGASVTSVNGLTGALTIANATGVGTTITINDASTSQKGIAQFNATNFTAASGIINTIQDIHVAATPTFGRLTLTSSQATSPMLLVNNTNAGATGNLIDLQLNGSSRMAVSPAGNMTLTGTLNGQTISSAANFTGSLTVATNTTVNGNLGVNGGSITSTGSLNVTPGGALTVGVAGQSLTLQGNGSTTLRATNAGNTTAVIFQTPTANVNYRLLTAAAGTYDICTTVGNCVGIGGGVDTPGGTTNQLAKFSDSNTIVDSIISDNGTTATIAGTLAVNTITPGGALTIGAIAQNLTLQGASTSLTATSGGFTNTLTFATPSGSGKTITIPNANGTVAVSASGPLVLDADGNLSCPTCSLSGSGVTSLNGLTGALTLANSSGVSTTITIDDASTSQKGIAQFNATNFTAASGTINTIQNINTAATPTFAGVNTNTITPSGALTVGATGQQFTLQGNAGSVINATSGVNTTTLSFQTPTANVNYRFATAAAGNYDVCTTVGNCAGVGGGVTTAGGTPGTIAKFTSSNAIGDSLLTETAGTITVNGDLNLTVGNQFQINGTQISSADLSNDANLAKLNASQTFTGNTNTFRNGSNSAIAFSVQNAATNRILTIDTTGGEVELGQGSTLGGRLVFNNATNANTITLVSSVASANRTITLPDDSGTICLSTGNCAGAGVTLQSAYNNSTSPEITVDATRGALTIRDAATPIAANLLEVEDNTGSTTYFAVTASGTSTTGSATATGDINSSGGSLQTGGTTRIDNSGNATNIGNISLSGSISGGTTYSGSGNINTTGGAIQTNSTTRVDNTGNLVNIGDITGTGAITIASTGAGNDITINGADQFIVQDAAVFNALSTFNTDVDMAFADTENLSITSTVTGTNSVNLIGAVLTNNTSSGTQQVAFLQNAAGSGATEGLLVLDNADTDTAVANGLQITSAAGGVTTAIDVSDPDIVTALLFGANDITGTNFSVTGGSGDITSAGNATLQGGTVTVGTSSQAGTLVLNDGSSNTGALQLAALGQNTIYTLPDPGGGTATICLTTGNCAGSGGGVTGSGTNNRLTKFTSTGSTVGDSSITDDGTTVSTTIDVVVQGGDLTVGGSSQLASLILNDGDGQTSTLQAGNSSGNLIFILPTNTGSANQCLKQSGAGNQLVWQDCDGGSGGSSATLQSAYNNGNSITTTDGRDIDIVLTTTDSNLDVVVADGSTSFVSFSRANGAGTADPAQMVLVDNLDADRALPIGIKLQSAAGGMTTAIDASDAEITDAISVGANNIVGTTGNIDLTNFDVVGATGNITTAGDLAVNGGDISSSSSLTISSSGAGNDVIINGADQFIVQDPAQFNAQVNMDLGANDELFISGTGTGANTRDYVIVSMTNDTTSGTQRGIFVQNNPGTGATEALVVLDNADTDTAVPVGLQITAAAGGVTTGIDLSDADITDAVNVGANNIVGTTGNIDLTNFDVVGSSGNTTVGGTLGVTGATTLTGDLAANGNTTIGNANTDTLTVTAVLQGASPLVFEGGTADASELTLAVATLTADRTITLPDETGTVCLQSSTNCGFALSSGSANYIQNQTAVDQTADFRISGTGRVNTALLAPAIRPITDGTTALQLQNAAGSSTALVVDTTNLRVGIGAATAPGEALDVTGNLVVKDSGNTKSYRFRTSGSELDFESSGAALTVSTWSGAGFTGTQRNYLILEEGSHVAQAFGAWQFRTADGATVRHSINGTAAADVGFNQNGEATNFTVQGDTDANLLYVQGSTDRVGIGTASPNFKLDVNGTLGVTGNTTLAGDLATNGNTTIGDANTDTLTVTAILQGASPLVFEGGTADANELTLAVATLSADRTITLPNETGTVCLQSSASCGFITGSGTAFLQGGNSFGAIATLGTNDNFAINIRVNTSTVATFGTNGSLQLRNSANSTTALDLENAAGDNIFTVNTTNSRVGINLGANNTPTLNGSGLEVQGGLRLSGGGSGSLTDQYTTPLGAGINAKINIPNYDPGNGSNTIIAAGMPTTASSLTSTVISVFDPRTNSNHWPSIAVWSPDESKLLGLTWAGDNTEGRVTTHNATGATGGIALQSGDTAGTGTASGGVAVRSGNGVGSNNSTGDVNIDSGSPTGTGTAGDISIGTSNATLITIGNASSVTQVETELNIRGPGADNQDGIITFGSPATWVPTIRGIDDASVAWFGEDILSIEAAGLQIGADDTSPAYKLDGFNGRHSWATQSGFGYFRFLDGSDGDADFDNDPVIFGLSDINGEGEATFQNITDSDMAFRVLKGDTTPLFQIDTSNNRVYIGDLNTDTTGALLVLDSKSDSGDPTGVNGGMYYNGNSNTFRCYENGVWYDCLSRHKIVLGSNVADSSGAACTMTNITGLSFSVTSGTNYRFYAQLAYTAAATTTGSRFSVNGPASPTVLAFSSRSGTSATAQAVSYANTYDGGTCTTDSPSTASQGNTAIVEGTIRPSASGTFQMRVGTEVDTSAITVLAGSTLEWW